MSELYPSVDPDGLVEYSVVFTDRSLNHMSQSFRKIMNDISTTLKQVYNADAVAVVPGSGTFGMEAVARQLAAGANCLVIRNGWFSYRWTQIFEMGAIPDQATVLKAHSLKDEPRSPFAPPELERVLAQIKSQKPDLVFAPHVETSSGIMLPDDYLRAVAQAVHEVGGLFVLDCIASGALWVDMKTTGVDVMISAPQKGWSASPCCALIMLSEGAKNRVEQTQSSSFACDLKKWLHIMNAYEQGGYAYHATMPTDALASFRDAIMETEKSGFEIARAQQLELGRRVRTLLGERGFKSVAAAGFEAPGVVVCYTDDIGIKDGSKFASHGLQIAAGVPLQCDEPADFKTFRIGLFGLEKLKNIDRTLDILSRTLDEIES